MAETIGLKGDEFTTTKVKITPEGGIAIRLLNGTGVNSVRGQIVCSDTNADESFDTCGAGDPQPIGVVYEDGVADGSPCWIVIYGRAQVLIEQETASTHGNWIQTSDNALYPGYGLMTAAAPPGGGVAQLDTHMQEVGHCLESVAAGGAGVDQLAYCMIHLN